MYVSDTVEVTCMFKQKVWSSDSGDYVVAVYRVQESSQPLPSEIKAVGSFLPMEFNTPVKFSGRMEYNYKYKGVQLAVDKIIDVPTKAGIMSYLGSVKGIGPKTAEKIFDAFGLDSLNVLENDTDKLLQIRGISQAKLEVIKRFVEDNIKDRVLRDSIVFLAPYGIATWQVKKFYDWYGDSTLDKIKNHPYQLCEVRGVSFNTVDDIAKRMGFDMLSFERIDAGFFHVFAELESNGDCCEDMEWLFQKVYDLLSVKGLTVDRIVGRAVQLIQGHKLAVYNNTIYRAKMEYQERSLSSHIRMLSQSRFYGCADFDSEINRVESDLGVLFSIEQKKAVQMALTNGVSVVTGGPGTGKTLIQKAILDIYRRNHPGAQICCCAPTGRAARRMSQVSGVPASTIHKALKLVQGDDYEALEMTQLQADLVLVDEVSMLDVYLATSLLGAVKPGAQIVLIGDVDQLPSIGPGAVLRDIILSGCIAVTKLDKVFRQQAQSLIVTNSNIICHGRHDIQYGPDFQFIESSDLGRSSNIMIKLYLDEVRKYGLDNVALLSPYRKKTDTGVNALNLILRDVLNPSAFNKKEMETGHRKFRVGDRVMQVKNYRNVNNGDIGYVTGIFGSGFDLVVRAQFDDDRVVEYDQEHLSILDWGYAFTVHKSQGSEYKVVICNVQWAHKVMLNRQLIYTAITRGREKVILVGEQSAFQYSIDRVDTDVRCTGLAQRLRS